MARTRLAKVPSLADKLAGWRPQSPLRLVSSNTGSSALPNEESKQ